jgi:putative endonuclease
MTEARIALGKRGEDLACQELERRGYAIVARRFRVRSGELDIVARDGATLVFVEVKARAGQAFGTAAEAVTPMKQLRMTRLADEYLMRNHLHDCPCRFDVVSVHFDRDAAHADAAEIVVIQNAFDA